MAKKQYRSFNARLSQGAGPVFEVRRALNVSQAKMAALMGYKSYSSVAACERKHVLPDAPRKRQQLVRVAQRYAPPSASPYVIALAKGQQTLEF